MITLVFSTQALGLIVGPLIAIILLSSGVNQDLIWRLMLAFGAVPALATFYLRRQIAESPRFALSVGNSQGVAEAVAKAMQQTYNAAVASDTGDLVNKSLTLRGPGANTLAISSGSAGYGILITPNIAVSLSGLSFKNSIVMHKLSSSLASFISNEGTLTLTNSIISGNTAVVAAAS